MSESRHERGAGRLEEQGDCRIDVYLNGVSVEEVDEIVERIADVLADCGLAAEDEDSQLRSLVGVKPVPWPDLEDEATAAKIIDDYSEWVIPGAGDAGED